MKKLKCPYCCCPADVNEFGDPGDRRTLTCSACGKTFGYTFKYVRRFNACELPCANGAPHEWVYFPIDNYRCEYCGEVRTELGMKNEIGE